MKKTFLLIATTLVLFSCSKSNIGNDNCRFLLNVAVNTSINLNLPQYSQLQFISNSVYVPNAGNGGIIVINTGTGFMAWDAADPNHTPSSCSILNISSGEGTCGCADENTYSLFTGQPLGNPDLRCGLKNYRVQLSGNDLIITN